MKKTAENKEINGLIFKEVLKRGYSLEGKTRVWDVADSKLWYLKPNQAKAYLDVLDSSSYQKGYAPKEEQMIEENIDFIAKRIGNSPVNLVDLGCGDGRKAVIFIEELSKKTKVRYCPIDISSYMVQKAIENISKLKKGEIVESHSNISDFENLENVTALLNSNYYQKNLFLLLGNTLSNFEFHDLLYQIRSSMKTGDYLIIGNGIENASINEDIVTLLKTNLNDFLIMIPMQIGIDKSDLTLDIRFRNHRLEFYYNIKKDHKIEFGDKKLELKVGDQLVVAVSYHYSKEDFRSFLNLYFDEVTTKFSKDGSYALAICKK